jgi:type VI secretion system protein ImpB
LAVAINDEIPKSRLTLTYRTNVSGQPEDVLLPLRLLILGDLSLGTSKDRAADLDQRGVRNLDGRNLDHIMADMGISVKATVANKIDPESGEELAIDLPIRAMKSFTPAEIAQHVPKIKALLLLKQTLIEMQGNIDNRKEFRNLLRAVAADDKAIGSLADELKGFDALKLPKKAESAS